MKEVDIGSPAWRPYGRSSRLPPHPNIYGEMFVPCSILEVNAHKSASGDSPSPIH